jgi:hypothetical protein
MSDPINDPRPLEERVTDLQFKFEALRMDLQDARGRVSVLEMIVAKLIQSPSFPNRLSIAAEFREFFERDLPVHDDGGGGK